MSSIGKAVFGSRDSSSTTQTKNTKMDKTQTTTPFSGDALNNYNDYVNSAKNNYANTSQNLNNLITLGQTAWDTSWLKETYNKYKNMDNTNLNTLNTMSVNPNDNADWTNAQNAIDSNARKSFGSTLNQVNQNIIGKGMANGSGHQTAAYNASANLESTLASDRAKRWTEQYNTNINNTLKANEQLSDFYNKLAEIGVNYAKLTQEDTATLLNAYNAQNDALKTYGNAVAMGSNPTVHTTGTENTTATSDTEGEHTPSLWSDIMNVGTASTGGFKGA
jgi:hypothetical protein